jgi:hypothetical protein
MSIITIERPVAQAAAPKAGAKDKSQLWLNVGMNLPIQQPDGTIENVFVTLPFGLAIDTMSKSEMKGSSTEYAKLHQAKNWLLEQLQDAGQKLSPGDAHLINGLQLQLRRVGETAVVDPGTNQYIAAMQNVFAA